MINLFDSFIHVCNSCWPHLLTHPILFSFLLHQSLFPQVTMVNMSFCFVFVFSFERLNLNSAAHRGMDMKVSTSACKTHHNCKGLPFLQCPTITISSLGQGWPAWAPLLYDWEFISSFLYKTYVGNHRCCEWAHGSQTHAILLKQHKETHSLPSILES